MQANNYYGLNSNYHINSHISSRPKKRGLTNIANNCYMNSIIQMLASISHFAQQLMAEPSPKDSITSLFIELLHGLQTQDTQGSLNPSKFHSAFLEKRPNFTFGAQEDANEFLQALLDQISLETRQKDRSEEGSSIFSSLINFLFSPNSNISDAEKFWLDCRKKEESIVTKYFNGVFENLLTCQKCTHTYSNFEEFNQLNLAMNGQYKSQDLKKLIEANFREEPILNLQCRRCFGSRHLKQTKIVRYPRVLVFALKRFRFLNNQAFRENTEVSFPMTLEMGKVSSPNYRGLARFHLHAIIHHTGTCHHGHYYVTCNYGNEGWLRFDDSIVDQIRMENKRYDTFGSQTPYMLVYLNQSEVPA